MAGVLNKREVRNFLVNLFETTVSPSTHTHRPLVVICISFCLGIILNLYFNLPLLLLLVLTAVSLSLSLLNSRNKISTFFLLITVLLLGWVHSKHYQTLPFNHISYLYYEARQNAMLEGIVVSDVEPRKYFNGMKTVFALQVKRMKSGEEWQAKSGLVLVNIFRAANIQYGDHLILEGKLHRPFAMTKNGSSSSYRDYLERQGITFIFSIKKDGRAETLKRKQGNPIMDLSLRLKHRLNRIFYKYLQKEKAGIMQAFILGDRYDIPKDIFQLFRLSGVAHIIAISGFNVGIVAFMILLFLKMLPMPRR
ncbi:MAG: ComEC family competence protein, partial [Candidatus Omnitrophica bacterium]|nr:ComEC family competence protein [Candidatus Omnitrophota bacterium]